MLGTLPPMGKADAPEATADLDLLRRPPRARESTRANSRDALIDAAHANYTQAAQKYEVVLGIDPTYTPALFNLAILRKNSGDSAQAVALYRRLLAVNPKYAAAHMNLGLLLRATGQKQAGDAEVRQAITLNPKLKDPAAG